MARRAPVVIVVMGVSGAGKSTVGRLLAERLGWEFADGDRFHPSANVKKMHAGVPLTDEDRWPWLDAIAVWIDQRRRDERRAVIACSALRRSYRTVIIGERGDVGLVFLEGAPSLVRRRQAARRDHFMPAALLDSQFATLEPPGADENPIRASIEPAPHEIVRDIIEQLETRGASAALSERGHARTQEESPG